MTANELKNIRKKNSLTQSKMATFLGITLRTIQKYESGENAIPVSIGKLLKHEFNSYKDIMLREVEAIASPNVDQAEHPYSELLAENTALKAIIVELKQDKAHLQATVTSQQEQISFLLKNNKELEETLCDYQDKVVVQKTK